MNFLADESVDAPIVAALRADGHDVHSVAELEPSIPDEEVLQLAEKNKSILLTSDKDFGELVYRRAQISSGVVLIRLSGLSLDSKVEIVLEVIRDHVDELTNAFTVVSAGMVRIRRGVPSDDDSA